MPEGRRRLIASVMAELRGYIDAVDAFETAVAQHFGLTRQDLQWFLALRDPDGMALDELAGISGLSPEELREKLERLQDAGHARLLDDGAAVEASPPARELLAEVFAPIEAAETGLHRYGADELGIVRSFLRVGRQFYERQFRRLQRSRGMPGP